MLQGQRRGDGLDAQFEIPECAQLREVSLERRGIAHADGEQGGQLEDLAGRREVGAARGIGPARDEQVGVQQRDLRLSAPLLQRPGPTLACRRSAGCGSSANGARWAARSWSRTLDSDGAAIVDS